VIIAVAGRLRQASALPGEHARAAHVAIAPQGKLGLPHQSRARAPLRRASPASRNARHRRAGTDHRTCDAADPGRPNRRRIRHPHQSRPAKPLHDHPRPRSAAGRSCASSAARSGYPTSNRTQPSANPHPVRLTCSGTRGAARSAWRSVDSRPDRRAADPPHEQGGHGEGVDAAARRWRCAPNKLRARPAAQTSGPEPTSQSPEQQTDLRRKRNVSRHAEEDPKSQADCGASNNKSSARCRESSSVIVRSLSTRAGSSWRRLGLVARELTKASQDDHGSGRDSQRRLFAVSVMQLNTGDDLHSNDRRSH
jgi:hypothetical protein